MVFFDVENVWIFKILLELEFEFESVLEFVLVSEFELDSEYAFQLGFFHDIGKPWAKKFIQTKKGIKSSTKGHAQVGENICCELGLDNKISWCVPTASTSPSCIN